MTVISGNRNRSSATELSEDALSTPQFRFAFLQIAVVLSNCRTRFVTVFQLTITTVTSGVIGVSGSIALSFDVPQYQCPINSAVKSFATRRWVHISEMLSNGALEADINHGLVSLITILTYWAHWLSAVENLAHIIALYGNIHWNGPLAS